MADKDRPGQPDEETKRKFREALEKKQAHAGRTSAAHGPSGKVGGTSRGGTSEKSFRRKSG